MRVKYIGESDPLGLLTGKEYAVLSAEKAPEMKSGTGL